LPKLIRKTSTMSMMEYKFGKPIDDLILDSIKQANGEQREASNILGIAESTLSRWVNELNLIKYVSKIRRENGLIPTTRALRMEISGQEVIELAVQGRCTDCNQKFEEFTDYNITGITKIEKNTVAIIRDQLNIKHWFNLDLSVVAI